jgi:hypothetical protein
MMLRGGRRDLRMPWRRGSTARICILVSRRWGSSRCATCGCSAASSLLATGSRLSLIASAHAGASATNSGRTAASALICGRRRGRRCLVRMCRRMNREGPVQLACGTWARNRVIETIRVIIPPQKGSRGFQRFRI